MALIHGQRILADEVERITSQFSEKDFVSLFNAIIWGIASKECSSLPSFTEQTKVKDGGIDAEWTNEFIFFNDSSYSSGLVTKGWNVYQFKQRDISPSGRNNVFSQLKSELRGAAYKLYLRTENRPSHYIVFTNLQLGQYTEAKKAAKPQKGELKKAVLEGYDEPDKVQIQIIGAAEIAKFLDDLPHIRSGFFATNNFLIWEKAWLREQKIKLYGANVDLIGRDNDLAKLKTMVDNPEVRAIIISGSHDIGKTRIALETTKHRPTETVIALDRSMRVSDLLALESPKRETLVIIEDPESEKIEDFIKQSLSSESLKLIITLPNTHHSPKRIFANDQRVQSHALKGLSEDDSRKLLRSTKADFDYRVESWIVKQAGGNPGIILQAANFGDEFRKETEDFIRVITSNFEAKIFNHYDRDILNLLKLLSLLSYVGFRKSASNNDLDPSKELRLICKHFNIVDGNAQLVDDITKLGVDGIVQIRGLYVEVIPPLIAKELAIKLIQNDPSNLLKLFDELDQSGKLRLIERLIELPPYIVIDFWDNLFSATGLLKDFETALKNSQIFRLVASAVPDRVANLILNELETMSLELRQSIKFAERDALIWAIEELIFREKYSSQGLKCLKPLAETDIGNLGYENNSNSASSKFCQCFQPTHAQISLTLSRRFAYLKSITTPEKSIESQLLGIEVIKTVLNRWGYNYLHEESGSTLIETKDNITWGEAWEYREQFVHLLIELAESDNLKVANAAREAIPNALAEFSLIQFSFDLAISSFQKVVEWAVSNIIPIPISKLVEKLELVIKFRERDKEKADPETVLEIDKLLSGLNDLLVQLDKADFSIRLKRWTGQRNPSQNDLSEDGSSIDLIVKKAKELAKEVIDNPELLSDELWDWLCSPEAQQDHKFCFWLGQLDIKKYWLQKIKGIGALENGSYVFAAYFEGLNVNDCSFVSNLLNQLLNDGKVTAAAIFRATIYLKADLAGVIRLEKLALKNQLNPHVISSWITDLNSTECLRLLKAMAGENLENVCTVIDSFSMWLHKSKLIEEELADFAWKCLKAANTVDASFNADQLAYKLSQDDPENGFNLLRELLVDPPEKVWNPIDRHGHRDFWENLYRHNRERTVHIVLSSALYNSQFKYYPYDVKTIISQEINLDLLLEFSMESEKQAELMSYVLPSDHSSFWSTAFIIIEKYPKNTEIKNILSDSVIGYVFGNPVKDLEIRRKNVESAKVDCQPEQMNAYEWLQSLASRLDDLINKYRQKI